MTIHKKKTNTKYKRFFKIFSIIFCILLLGFSIIAYFAAKWYNNVYGNTGFDSILYTLFSTLNGVETTLVSDYITDGLFPALVCLLFISFILFFKTKHKIFIRNSKGKVFCIYPFHTILSALFSIIFSMILLLNAAKNSGLYEYMYYSVQQSAIYENEYVNPDTVEILFPDEKRNLIYIYLESMETTYLSQELGGGEEYNLIPGLYKLAEKNINFSQNQSVGGFRQCSGATWTVAAMVAQTSGLPLKTPPGVDDNQYGENDSTFLPGVISLTNILNQNGYYQALMVGSDSNFGGRKQYFSQHDMDEIYDLYTARTDGIIPEDYYVWWGMEDKYLFQYAKQKITEIASYGSPFAFTMLTADTHFPDGFVCDYCKNKYAEQYDNVIACSSKQVSSFIKWIQKQDFYENTTIIICGDHCTMDSGYIERNIDSDYDRRVFNCFINSAMETDYSKNREFTTLDMFPTTLAALGCQIEGDRLGLGTNLFSGIATLAETMGYDALDAELAKSSAYYMRNFYFSD